MLLENVGLTDLADRKIATLSGGQRRRLDVVADDTVEGLSQRLEAETQVRWTASGVRHSESVPDATVFVRALFEGSVASGAAVAVIVTVLVVLTLHVAGVVRKRGRHQVGVVVATELPVILMSVSLGLWLGYGVAALGVLILVSPPSIT